jgi:hypothetical protein
MAEVRKCVKCGRELSDTDAALCPACGARIVAGMGNRIWIVALIQLAFVTGFMFLFHFPKFMIVMFGIMVLMATAFSQRARMRPRAQPAPQPTAHLVLFRVLSVLIALCAFVFLAFLLLGSVMVANELMQWQQYRGKTYHRTEFEVTRSYYQKSGKGHDIYASGMVDGQREWMSLMPYLHTQPRSQEEVEERVPPGTVIRIYLFPQMKGRMRVRVDGGVPPADAYYQSAMTALKNSLLGLALTGLAIFVLSRIRRICFAPPTPSFQEAAAGPNPLS